MTDAALVALHRHAERLWETVSPHWPGFSIDILPSIDSTNSELMRRARAGRYEPVLLVAAEQTAGRGRRGRHWVSQPGDSLTLSIGVPLHPADWSGLSLAVGASIATSLAPAVQLKWPNDLWWNGRKLGGILVETASQGDLRYAVIGVGLNLQTPTLDPALADPQGTGSPPVAPVGLLELLGHPADPPDVGDVLWQCAPALMRDLQRFETDGFAAFAARFASRDALYGQSVKLSDGQAGTAVGVRHDGALLVDTGRQVLAVTQQEVSVRPC